MATPSLHIRQDESGDVKTCLPPFSQSGRLIGMEGDWIILQAGRRTMSFFIPDLVDLLGGNDNTRRLLRNALQYEDFIELRVTNARLAYRNEAQYERLLREFPASEM